MCPSKGGDQRKTFLPSANNFMQPATVGNAVKGFKKCGIETHNLRVFSEHDFAASKATDHDVVDDEIENSRANPQTLVVENQHINHLEEPEHMAHADYDALKKPTRLKLCIRILNKDGVCKESKVERQHPNRGRCPKTRTATAGSDVVQSGGPIFDDFFQHLWPYIGNNTANVVFQMVKRLWLIRIDQ
ncbi:hypothetical protein TNCV_4408321 [Trichonephila clavipes]|nr:hypothetical protein TNCV_4408321 [Trichonephila clavipes]